MGSVRDDVCTALILLAESAWYVIKLAIHPGNTGSAEWFDAVDISETDRQKIGRLNASKLFGLGLD